MRRSFSAGIGVAAVIIVAACSDTPQNRQPLTPTGPLLAASDQCSGALMSAINKDIKDAFADPAEADLLNQAAVIKAACPNAFPQMMSFFESQIGYSGAPVGAAQGQLLSNLVAHLSLYVTGSAVVRPASVWMSQGGIAVLSGGEFMTTYDGRARLDIDPNVVPSTPHLYTFDPQPSSACDGITTLRVTGNCYNLQDYPHETSYTPASTLTFCLHSSYGPGGISHARTGFGDEVLPDVATPTGFTCTHTDFAINSWLGREAGPLGRLVAKTYDYLRPRPLFADDAGESGSIGLFSYVGGALTVVFEDGFTANATGPLADDTDPVVGDFPSSWDVNVLFPGYVQIQNGFGDLTGNVVVLSQALGNCSACPTVSLLGTRVNPSATDTIGSYEITWQSLQSKPSVKEAPFVVRSFSGAEIARLSYVTEQSANLLKYNGQTVVYNGSPVTWTVDTHQDFRITVNLYTLNGQNNFTTSLAIRIGGSYQTVVSNVPFTTPSQRTVSTIGYYLSGIDAGVIAADNFLMKRLSDQP